ncbi:hypothetical protein B0A55_12774 [Friedmanniomyces simplex]|uniref:Uncharacterized protein n=1 Tax=Friedmanniomyces simplex TaxID=329884 RepID=A0A4U0VQY4_9PEZI|nr:hypothetical protein B0A55_12774 [Friedmanniomyces simplex]
MDKTLFQALHDIKKYVEHMIDDQVKRRPNLHCEANCTVIYRRVFSLIEQLEGYKLCSKASDGQSLESMLRSMEGIRLHEPSDTNACGGGRLCVKNSPSGELSCYVAGILREALKIRRAVERMEL